MRAARAAVLLAALGILFGCGDGEDEAAPPAPRERTPGPREPAPAPRGNTPEQLRRAFADAVRRAEPVSPTLHPRLAPAESRLRLEASLAGGELSRRGGELALTTPAGMLRAEPSGGGSSAARLLAGDQAALFDRAGPGADLLTRAAPAGFTTYVLFRDTSRPRAFAWRVAAPGGGRIERLAKGNAAVVVSGGGAGVSSPSLPADDRLIATVSAPLALDSRGRRVKSRLVAEVGELRLAIAPQGRTVFPVAARLEWIPSGAIRDGWFAYGVATALRRSAYTITGKRIEGLCAEEEQGTLEPGEVEVSRQVASRERDCRSLVETGNP